MLLFKKKFLPAIRSGEKTQTIRLWPFCRMKAGQRSYIPGAGYIRVLGVDQIALSALSDVDAQPDNHSPTVAQPPGENGIRACSLRPGIL